MRKPFVAGNWKMNTDSRSSVELAKAVVAGSAGVAREQSDRGGAARRLCICRRW